MANLPSPIPTVALASATSAQDAVRAGATMYTNHMMPGSLGADCTVTIASGSVTGLFKWQTCADGTNWRDVHGPENAAYVTLSATGSIYLPCPLGAMGANAVRIAAILGGAVTAGTDLTVATYYYRPYKYAA